MANGEIIAFNIAAFLCALFVLEAGADKFIDHTAIISKRLGISQSVVALLTAGAEWEEVSLHWQVLQFPPVSQLILLHVIACCCRDIDYPASLVVSYR